MPSDRLDRRPLAVVLVALLAVLAGCSGAQMGSNAGGGADSAATGQQSGAGGGGVGSFYTDDGDRVIVREADMDLRVDNFSRSFQDLRGIADRYGGFVGDRSQRSEGEWDSGHVTVRVPAENFSAARDRIARLGHLEDENVRAMDFTNEFENRQDRIRGLQRDRRELRRLLNETDNASSAARLRDELQEVRAQLRELQAQQENLRQREALSTIRVSMHEPERRKPPENFQTAFGFADAFTGAFYGGLQAVKYVIVFFGYAIPGGLALLLLGTFGFGLFLVWKRISARMRALLSVSGSSSLTDVPSPDEDDAGGEADSDGDDDTGEREADADSEVSE